MRAATAAWIEAALQRGQTVTLDHQGTSMRPALEPGDRITVRACTGAPALGRVLVTQLAGRLVAHRLVARHDVDGQERLVLRGDANPGDDPALPSSAILGEMVAVERARRGLLPNARRWLAIAWHGATPW